MKKRITITSIIMLFCSLLTMLVVSCLVVQSVNKKNAENQINNYLQVTCEVFDGTNSNEILDLYKNTDIRITIVDLDGNVVADNKEISTESHLNRPEIVNLGQCSWRYSSTLKTTMVYIACLDDGYYVRIAMPQNVLNEVLRKISIYGSVSLVAISIISIFVYYKLISKSMKPLGNQIKRLSGIVDKDVDADCDNVEVLSSRINDVQTLINEKIFLLENQRKQCENIIDYMEEGFLMLDEKLNVKMINKKFEDIFLLETSDVIDKSYIYAVRSPLLQNAINDAKETGTCSIFDFEYSDKHYIVSIQKDDEIDNHDGLFIYILDNTKQYQISKIKQDFFANASHELKSPLTAIIGYQQMIKAGILTEKSEIDDAIDKTLKESFRLNQLIIDMLELSRLESEKPTESETLNLKDVILGIEESSNVIAKKKKVKIENDIDDLQVSISKDDAIHLFGNLIDNAIKYSKTNGKVLVKIDSDNKCVSIKDNGIGISKENQGRVFERFYQVDKNRSKENGGTGLGLSIVKHICNKYELKLELHSELDNGSEFIVYFK